MPYTEFYADVVNGNNLNGGSLNSGAVPAASPVYSDVTGGAAYASGTGVISGLATDPTSTVAVGDWVGVVPHNGGSPVVTAARWARCTARDASSITVSTTVAFGAAISDATAVQVRVGGRFKGPNGTDVFPFGYISNAAKNTAGDPPRFNFMAGTYTMTGASTRTDHNLAGPIRFQGCNAAAGDLVNSDGSYNFTRPILQGICSSNGAGVGAPGQWTFSAAGASIADLDFQSLAASSFVAVLALTGNDPVVERVSARDGRAIGIYISSAGWVVQHSEVYNCDVGNFGLASSVAGFVAANVGILRSCLIHQMSNSSGLGMYINHTSSPQVIERCMFDRCGSYGVVASVGALRGIDITECGFRGHTTADIYLNATSLVSLTVQRCLFDAGSGPPAYAIKNNTLTSLGGRVVENQHYGYGTGLLDTVPAQFLAQSNNNALSVSPFDSNAANGQFRSARRFLGSRQPFPMQGYSSTCLSYPSAGPLGLPGRTVLSNG